MQKNSAGQHWYHAEFFVPQGVPLRSKKIVYFL